MNDGYYIFVLNGIIMSLPPHIQKVALLLRVWSCQVVMAPALEFIFRYYVVVR